MSELREQLESTLGHVYTIERELGGGGMSRVFVAEEKSLARKIVVKVLPNDGAAVSGERFKREIALAAQLQHPHIVPLLTAGEAAGVPYFTMPYVRGESLRTRLASAGELPIGEAVRILRQVASALAFAHDAGVVHRDIKPDNVLIAGDAAMVTDFGVAKALSVSKTAGDSGLTALGIALGTPAYMSPEQASADPHVDHRADIYSWGVLAYELLTGSTPFAGRPPQAMLAAHTSETPQQVTARRPSVPAPLAKLVMRCLEKRPADRPQRAQDLVQALDEITTPSGGLPPTAAAPTGTRPRVVMLVGVAAVIIGAAAVAFSASRQRRSASSVAVLPLTVVGGDTALEYLAQGLSDGVSADLLRHGVKVSPRATTNFYRDKANDPTAVARTLDVASVFIATLRPHGGKLTVVYDLVSSDGSTLAQNAVETDAGNAVVLEDQILQELLRVLVPRDSASTRTARATQRKVDPETYDLYLRALHLRNMFDSANVIRAIDLFKQAIARDPTFAAAYADMGWAYMQLADGYLPPREVVPQATSAIQRALQLDDGLAQAHSNLAGLYEQYLFDWDGAQREAERALALNPDLAEGYLWRAVGRLMRGDRAATLELTTKSLQRDPLSVLVNFSAIWFYSYAGAPDSAIARHRRLQELYPGFFYLEAFADDAYRMTGQLDSALALDEWGSKRAGRPLGGLILTLVQLGRRDEAQRKFGELEAAAARHYIPPEILARAALVLGDREKAIDYLEKGAEAQSALVQMVAWYPEYRRLLGHPRFERYLQRVHLTEFMHRRS